MASIVAARERLALLRGEDRADPLRRAAERGRRVAERLPAASSSERQSTNAFAAAANASSSCSFVQSGASAWTSPVAGLMTPNVVGRRPALTVDDHRDVGHVCSSGRSQSVRWR